MRNIALSMEGGHLVIRIDLSKSLGNSRTNKTDLIATTQGNIQLPYDPYMRLGVTLFRYRERRSATAKAKEKKRVRRKKRTRVHLRDV